MIIPLKKRHYSYPHADFFYGKSGGGQFLDYGLSSDAKYFVKNY
jgi:hypothetical protein